MVLTHVVALLRRFFRNSFDAMAEAAQLRRDLARRYPSMDQ